MEQRPVSAWTNEELKQEFKSLAARAETWTDADRKRLEQIVLERVRRERQAELAILIRRGSALA